MLRNFFNALIVARQATAARQVMDYLSDSQLSDIGYSRSTFIAAQTANLMAELDTNVDTADNSIPVNVNLVVAL
jgi:hypothetical protein